MFVLISSTQINQNIFTRKMVEFQVRFWQKKFRNEFTVIGKRGRVSTHIRDIGIAWSFISRRLSYRFIRRISVNSGRGFWIRSGAPAVRATASVAISRFLLTIHCHRREEVAQVTVRRVLERKIRNSEWIRIKLESWSIFENLPIQPEGNWMLCHRPDRWAYFDSTSSRMESDRPCESWI